MLYLKLNVEELFDEETQTFSYTEGTSLTLEHSLVSLSKWESEFQKPFLDNKSKTPQELAGYIKAMVVDENYDPSILDSLTLENLNEINAYIESSQTATTFGPSPKTSGRSETVTSELIYYWMIEFNIPFTCETWNLNRLFTLIRVCNIKRGKPKKMSKSELAQRNSSLNAQRKAMLNTTG